MNSFQSSELEISEIYTIKLTILGIRKPECLLFTVCRNWVFATNSDFPIPKTLPPDCVDLWYFKLIMLNSSIPLFILYLLQQNRNIETNKKVNTKFTTAFVIKVMNYIWNKIQNYHLSKNLVFFFLQIACEAIETST